MSNMARHLTLQSMKDKVAAVPGEEGAFLINAYGMMYEEITASCLIKIDLAGNMALSALDVGVHRLELTARSQLAAMATGAKLRNVPDKVLQETYMNYQPQTRRPYGVMEWPALLRKLVRMDPGYRE